MKSQIKIDNNYFERVEELEYLGTTITNQNSIQEEFKSRQKAEIACYNLVQNLLSSSFLSKNIKIKIQETAVFPVILCGWEECRLRVLEDRVL